MELLRRWWPLLKLLFVLAILIGVGLLFVHILQSEELQAADASRSPGQILWDEARAVPPAALVLAAALYLLGLGFSAAFWLVLMRLVGERLPLTAGVRAYYLSHLGKYMPLGKGWALVLRTSLATASGARPGRAALTATYEILTMMASGALLASILASWQFAHESGLRWRALALLALAGVPIVPGVFNRLIARVTSRFRKAGEPLPELRTPTLLGGLALTGCGWLCQGASLMVLLAYLPSAAWTCDPESWLRCTTFAAVSNVAGFIASTPGGLGVRELFLQQCLAPHLGARAVVAVLLLRVLWTLAELFIAAVVYWLPAGVRTPDGDGTPAERVTTEVDSNLRVEDRL